MGDLRYATVYDKVAASADPSRTLVEMSDNEVLAALAGASTGGDAYLANVIAVEAMNRARRREASMEAMAEGVLALDADGLITFANPAAFDILGHPRGSLRGRLAQDVLGIQIPGGRVVAHDRFLRADGSTFPAVFTVAPIEREGMDEGAVIVFRDATQDALAEERLRDALRAAQDAEKRARFLAEAGEVLAVALEPRVAIAAVARLAVPTLADWCFVHAVEREKLELVAIEHHEDAFRDEFAGVMRESPRAQAALLRVLTSGEPIIVGAIDDAALAPLGMDSLAAMLRRMRVTGALVVPLVTRGKALGTLSLVASQQRGPFLPEDVRTAKDLARRAAMALETARLLELERSAVRALHASVDAIRTSRERYRSLVEASAKLVWTADAQGRVDEIPGWPELTGLPDGRWRDAVHPDDLPRVTAAWEDALATEQPLRVSYRLRLADGSYRRFEMRAVPVVGPGGSVIEWVMAATDLEPPTTRE